MPDCPACFTRLTQIHRRSVDRVIDVFKPIFRYRCKECHWEGNLIDPDRIPQRKTRWRAALVSCSFITLAAGLVLMILHRLY